MKKKKRQSKEMIELKKRLRNKVFGPISGYGRGEGVGHHISSRYGNTSGYEGRWRWSRGSYWLDDLYPEKKGQCYCPKELPAVRCYVDQPGIAKLIG